ncbi:NtaA/DmoA family FMN-dependent monooxygenase [Cellulomonas sp. H30R-01]|uniref:Monooxygenase n=1 Tax=Cellulomonas algicola TaxID=2071633 RepID=A0A401V3W3_9CELL|nr:MULTISPECIES: NtaA/DmoA family FMN-dependent monooxygenase [Cellulomonas]QHT56240.1 NtaA/DmoA family FMN-dependent monooxygenase [Cellulomonas sp. H30R-01]GCD21561.1 monooxygenase [Cellulomonas algicola]
MTARRQMVLGAYHTVAGQHGGAWRVSTQATDTESLAQHRAAALTAQDALLHFLLVTDVLGEQGDPVSPGFHPRLEPAVLLAALAAATEHIGLVGSFSTTFSDPVQLARQLSSLDHVSGGRAGWNVVTSFRREAATALGADRLPDHAERYAKAADAVRAAVALWDAWQPDAVVRDRRTGRYVDPSRVRRVEHVSAHHAVRGVLPASRSPQGRPVLFQGGSSEAGLALAARYADVVLTAQDHLGDAVAFAHEVRARAADRGRERVLVLPGVVTVVADTRRQAQDVHDRLTAAIDDDHARARLSAILGWDTSHLPPDAPLDLAPAVTDGHRSRARLLHARAERDRLTVAELARVAAATRGHRLVVGTAQDVADELLAWFDAGAADGFLVGPAVMPSGLRRFARDVVPILQRAGAFRTARTPGTLREQLGLPPVRAGG